MVERKGLGAARRVIGGRLVRPTCVRRLAALLLALAIGVAVPGVCLAASPQYLRDEFSALGEPQQTRAAETIEALMVYLGENPRTDVAQGHALAATLNATLAALPGQLAGEYSAYVAQNPGTTVTLAQFEQSKQTQFLTYLAATTKAFASSPPLLTSKALDGLNNRYIRGYLAQYIASLAGTADPLAALLNQDPFEPADRNLFTTDAYADAVLYGNPTASSVDPEELLNATLQRRFGSNTTEINKAKAVFNDPGVIGIVPDPRLRAALAMLSGTPGQNAIGVISSGLYQSLDFGVPPSGNNATAEVVFWNGQKHIVFNNLVQFEDLRALSPTVAHETIHQDLYVTGREEMIGNVLTDLTYAKFLREDMTIGTQRTGLVQTRNTFLAALVNTRDANGRVNLLDCRGANIFPGGVDDPINANYAAAFDLTGPATPGNDMLDKTLSMALRRPITGANFDEATVTLLNDNLNDFLTPYQWLKTALALKMKVPLAPLTGQPPAVASRTAAPQGAARVTQTLDPALLVPGADTRASRSLLRN